MNNDKNAYQGALLDTRPEAEKQKDYKLEELLTSAAPVNWIAKTKDQFRKFPIYDQDGSGSCVAQTMKKLLLVYVWLKTSAFVLLSASHIYQRRANKPWGGMSGIDVFEIAQKGVTLEAFAPSERMSDAQMDAVSVNDFESKVGETFRIGNFVQPATRNIDLIASIIQETGKAVMVWFYFNYSEWTDVPSIKDPNLQLNASDTCRHSVAAVDFTLHNGKKALVIDDSWGPSAGNGAGQRIITEDFFKVRNFFAGHFMNFKFEGEGEPTDVLKPKYTFGRDLEFSATFKQDADVVALQDCLKWLGLFPANTDSTGYYGAVTRTAVQTFQIQNGIAKKGDSGFGRVGPKTRQKLNELFSN